MPLKSYPINPFGNKKRIAKSGILLVSLGSRSFGSQFNSAVALGVGNTVDAILDSAEFIRSHKFGKTKSINVNLIKAATRQVLPAEIANIIINEANADIKKYDESKHELNGWQRSQEFLDSKAPLTEKQKKTIEKFQTRREDMQKLKDKDARSKGFSSYADMKQKERNKAHDIRKISTQKRLKKKKESTAARKVKLALLNKERKEAGIKRKKEREAKAAEKAAAAQKESEETKQKTAAAIASAPKRSTK